MNRMFCFVWPLVNVIATVSIHIAERRAHAMRKTMCSSNDPCATDGMKDTFEILSRTCPLKLIRSIVDRANAARHGESDLQQISNFPQFKKVFIVASLYEQIEGMPSSNHGS